MSDNVADPLEQLSLAYQRFGETMADSISKTYETGVRYGAGVVSNQMNAMNAWAAGGWDMLFGFFPHNKATNIAISNAYYSLVNLMVNYPAEAMTRYYEEHDTL